MKRSSHGTPRAKREGYTILAVDDAVENIMVLSGALSEDYEIRFATDGKKALEIAGEGDGIDLILLDIMMPGMSGLDVLRELRRTRSARELPIIMVSARGDNDAVVTALELGANDYVTKPIELEVLKARIRAQLRVSFPTPEPVPAATRTDPTVPAKRSAQRSKFTAPRRPIDLSDLSGKVFAEKYRIEEKIGAGGCGTVYRATHLFLEKTVALKVLHTCLGTAAEHLARFQREGVAASHVRHPNAVSVLDFGVTGEGTAYLVMELLEGRSLRAEMKTHGALPCQRCCEILVPVCAVLGEAHRIGFLHRDLKPDNIFLHREGEEEIVKVVDFGTAKLLGGAGALNLTMEGAIVGTPRYMSPERLDDKPYDQASDIYSLGVMAYEMLTGRPPILVAEGSLEQLIMLQIVQEPTPLAEVAPSIPADLAEGVMAALAKNPSERPSAEDLGRRFGAALR